MSLVLLVIYILKIAQHLNSGIIAMHTLYYSKDNNLMIIINTSGAHRPTTAKACLAVLK